MLVRLWGVRALRRAGAVSGALLVAAAVVTPPAGVRADVACRDHAGWWCLYGKPNMQDGGGLIGTNNGDTDLKMNEDWTWFNDRTRSVSNRSKSYVGLYDDIDFKGLMACVPPNTQVVEVRSGVSSLRIHPTRKAACTTARPLKKLADEPTKTPEPEKRSEKAGGDRTQAPTAKVEAPEKPAGDAEASPGLELPSLGAPSPRLPIAPPVNAAATEPATDEGGGPPWGDVFAAVGAAAATLLVLAVLGIGGWIFGRRRHAPVPVPRTATDPGAAFRVHHALLLLAIDCEQGKRDVPAVRAVTIDDTEVALHLAGDGESAAPPPWRVAPGGRRWHLSVTDIDELTDDVDPEAPYPLLAMVRPGMWANLAALPGPIALTGNRKAARRAAVELARWLRESPWHEGVRVRTVGFGSEASIEPEAGTERGRAVFINDGLQVPAKTPPGSAVIAVGRPDGAGTTWRVRFNGSIVPPAGLLANDPAPAPAAPGPDADSDDPALAGQK